MIQKKAVVVGGGNGAAVSILALKRHLDAFDISAVITMSDSGGSSGRLRREFNTLPAGDILRATLAMSKYDYYTLRQIFYEERFAGAGKLDTHNLGNLFLTLAGEYSGDYTGGAQALAQALACVGRVYPVTLEPSDLCALLKDGQVIKGEVDIDRPRGMPRDNAIQKVWLEPDVTIYTEAAAALRQADYIIFGPGSLYTSIVPNLLVGGVADIIRTSSAKLVYVIGNGYEADGELGPRTMRGFAEALERYVPRPFDMILYNTADLGPKEQRLYAEKRWAVAERDIEQLKDRYTLIGEPFERDGGGLSKEKLGDVFKRYLTAETVSAQSS